ncbi:cache domain-containing sensor histidine kinase [Paenibacillus cymbidii]|uniref:cache domain-containing sensor histidine kinase n=1 Tax=Paenibacillus cymbidii TaxID=1639034 RepID=UPI001436967F|nr:sensor histidine kinase [Paenibacillus cymbidii]
MKKIEMKFNNFLLLFSLAVVLVLLLIISSIVYAKTKSYIDEKVAEINSIKMKQASYDVSKSLNDAYNTLDNLRSNARLIEYFQALKVDQPNSYRKSELSKQLEGFLFNLKKDNAFIRDIVIMANHSQYSALQTYLGFTTENLVLKTEAEGIRFVAAGKTNQALQPDESTALAHKELLGKLNRHVYLYSALLDDRGVPYGTAFLLLDPGSFRELIPYHDDIALFSQERDYLYRGKNTIGADPIHMLEKDIAFQGFTIQYLIHPDFQQKELRLTVVLIMLTFLGCSALAFVCSRLVTGPILLPMHRLMKWVEKNAFLQNRIAPIAVKTGMSRLFTMRDRFLLYFLITILLPLFVFIIVFYNQSFKIVTGEMKESYGTLFAKTVDRLNLFVNQKETVLARLTFDQLVRDFLIHPDPAKETSMQDLIQDNVYLGLGNDTVSIYNANNQLLVSNRYKQKTSMNETFAQEMRSTRRSVNYQVETDKTFSSIALGMQVFDFSGNAGLIGFMKLDLDRIYLSELFSDFKESGSEVLIVDRHHTIVAHQEAELLGKSFDQPIAEMQMEKRGEFYYYTKQLEGIPWYFVFRFPYTNVHQQTMNLLYDDIYFLVIIFLLVLVFSYVMSHYLHRPLHQLNLYVMRIRDERSDRSELTHHYGIYEVDQLSQTFNRMLMRMENLVEEAVTSRNKWLRLELEKRETQIMALQAQINPHFLYNTLENINYLIEFGEKDSAMEMITALSRLFRYSINQDKMTTTVREELYYANAYINIMAYRYKERMEVRWLVDERINNYETIKLILQPIIENAIQHNVQHKAEKVTVTVHGSCEDDCIRFTVADDGAGIAPAELAQIRQNLQRNDHHRIGLYNVSSRIKLHYGDKYGLSIDSELHNGTVVTINIPKLPKILL